MLLRLQISIREGEDILLLSNPDPNVWKIRNGKGEEGMVPALTVLIPGPYKEAVDAAVKYVSRNEKKKKLVIYNMGHNIMQISGMKRD